MVYSHIDRIIVIGMMPVFAELKLEAGKELAADYFLALAASSLASSIRLASGLLLKLPLM